MSRRRRPIDLFPIRRGRHARREDGMSALELVAWLGGEDHTDRPRSCCPVLARLVQASNDLLPDDDTRGRYLRALLPRLVNSRTDGETGRRRAYLAADCTARFFAALAAGQVGHHLLAEELRRLPPIVDAGSARPAATALIRAGRAIHPATWTVTRAAAGEPAERWIAGAAHAARAAKAWRAIPRLVEDMLRIRPASDAPRAG